MSDDVGGGLDLPAAATSVPGPAPVEALGPAPSASSVPRPSGLLMSPFKALRFDAAVAGHLSTLTSPPYDVLDEDGVTLLEQANDHNIVRLILPRAEPDATQAGDDRYARAASRLAAWRAAGVLVPDTEPALYVYEQAEPGGHVQRGLLGALALTPAEDGIVLPHENTMSATVSDRLALYTAVAADLEPIFLLYDGGGATSSAVAAVSDRAPLLDVALPDGLRHRLWALTDATELAAIAHDLAPRTALIADGHHRYATYLQRQQAAHAAGHGAGPWDTGLCLLVDATAFGPQVHPIHRVVPGSTPSVLADRAAAGMTVRRIAAPLATARVELERAGAAGPAFLLASGEDGASFLLTDPDPAALRAALPADRSAAWAALDVSVLHAFVVTSLWTLDDDVEHVGYAHDVAGALHAAGADGTAVLLNPTPIQAVAAVASAGERMPRKSTLFTPKPRTGLVIRDHRDA